MAYRFVDTMTLSLWNGKALAQTPVPLEKLKLVSDAVYTLCDAKDGLKDGLIDDPRQCHFDPARDVRQCDAGTDAADCLTSAPTAAIIDVYSGYLSNGQRQYVGFEPGGEAVGTHPAPPLPTGRAASGWASWLVVPRSQVSGQLTLGETFMKYFAFDGNPGFDWHSFDFDKDPTPLDGLRRLLGADNPDLPEFGGAGSKLLMHFGWADIALPPQMGINYYENGSRHVSLLRRHRDRPVRRDDRADRLGGGGIGTRRDPGGAHRCRQDGADPPAVPLSSSRALPRCSPDEARNFACKIP